MNDVLGSVSSEEFNAEKFLKWFKEFDLKSTKINVHVYRDIYYMLPFKLANLLDKLYRFVKINIHEESPTRKVYKKV